eukprot:SAG31_NODE_9013_length_1347_cov_65.435897_2_plen_75_part_00
MSKISFSRGSWNGTYQSDTRAGLADCKDERRIVASWLKSELLWSSKELLKCPQLVSPLAILVEKVVRTIESSRT